MFSVTSVIVCELSAVFVSQTTLASIWGLDYELGIRSRILVSGGGERYMFKQLTLARVTIP